MEKKKRRTNMVTNLTESKNAANERIKKEREREKQLRQPSKRAESSSKTHNMR